MLHSWPVMLRTRPRTNCHQWWMHDHQMPLLVALRWDLLTTLFLPKHLMGKTYLAVHLLWLLAWPGVSQACFSAARSEWAAWWWRMHRTQPELAVWLPICHAGQEVLAIWMLAPSYAAHSGAVREDGYEIHVHKHIRLTWMNPSFFLSARARRPGGVAAFGSADFKIYVHLQLCICAFSLYAQNVISHTHISHHQEGNRPSMYWQRIEKHDG
jgi:hypothetical protein